MAQKQALEIPKATMMDMAHSAAKGALSAIPYAGGAAAEFFAVAIAPPLERRRAEWMESVVERLIAVEAKADNLKDNPSFVTVMVQANFLAQRTHQEEKLEALRNAVVNTAIGKAPEDDLQAIFLNLVDSFTPIHLSVLKMFLNRSTVDPETFQRYRAARDVTDLIVNQLLRDGLIEDQRPYAARGRDNGDSLVCFSWPVTNLGKQFLAFISS